MHGDLQRARFIKEQIDSILPQLGADDELIVSDDGSTDGTMKIIASYGDARIKGCITSGKKSANSMRTKFLYRFFAFVEYMKLK